MFGLHPLSLAIGVGVGSIPGVAIYVKAKVAALKLKAAPIVAEVKADIAQHLPKV